MFVVVVLTLSLCAFSHLSVQSFMFITLLNPYPETYVPKLDCGVWAHVKAQGAARCFCGYCEMGLRLINSWVEKHKDQVLHHPARPSPYRNGGVWVFVLGIGAKRKQGGIIPKCLPPSSLLGCVFEIWCSSVRKNTQSHLHLTNISEALTQKLFWIRTVLWQIYYVEMLGSNLWTCWKMLIFHWKKAFVLYVLNAGSG